MAMKIVTNTPFGTYSVQYSVQCTAQYTVYSTVYTIFFGHHRHVGCLSTHWVVSCVSCEMSEKATARNTDLEQEPVVQMQWPKVFLEKIYGLFKVFGLFLLNIYHLVMLKFEF